MTTRASSAAAGKGEGEARGLGVQLVTLSFCVLGSYSDAAGFIKRSLRHDNRGPMSLIIDAIKSPIPTPQLPPAPTATVWSEAHMSSLGHGRSTPILIRRLESVLPKACGGGDAGGGGAVSEATVSLCTAWDELRYLLHLRLGKVSVLTPPLPTQTWAS